MTVLAIGEGSLPEIGGKAVGLAALQRLGMPVPPAVVLPASAGGVLADAEEVAARIGEPMAVRSSGVHEDREGRSAAGQYDSLMGVTADQLAAAVDAVYRSGSSMRAQAYQGAAETGMAVIIQREIPSSRAGVAFSRDPLTGEDVVLVEAVFGHGDQLVSGETNPDRFAVTATGTMRARLAPREGPLRTLRTLRDDEALKVAALTRQAQSGLGHPVDIEFCFERRKLWFLQCRAITTS